MQVFIGNLPQGTSNADLRIALYNAMNRSILRRLGFPIGPTIDVNRDVKFRLVHKKHGGREIHYCVATFENAEAGQYSIKGLHRAKVRGNRIVAREYAHRAYFNDQRSVGTGDKRWQGIERRSGDRRGAREFLWEAELSM